MNQPFLPPSASTLELRKEHEDDRSRGQVYNPSNQMGHKTVKSSRTRRIATCVVLHAGLVLVHAGLFVVWSRHYEHAITVDIDTAASIRLPLIVTAVSQVIGTIYLALLVLTTQQLSLQRDLQTRQTLTAIHDKSSAWLGLASSLSSLWQQWKIPTAVWGVIDITLYLGGIFALHVTIPSLFHVVPYNTIVKVHATTQLARSVVFENEVINTNVGFDPTWYDILLFYNELQFPTVGLVDNIVYDVLSTPLPSAAGNFSVNATRFDVDCAALPQAQQTPGVEAVNEDMSENTVDLIYTFQVDPSASNVSFIAPARGTLSMNTGDSATNQACLEKSSCINCGCPSALIVSATIPVLDATGAQSPLTPITPQLKYTTDDNSTVPISAVQLLACDIHTRNTTISLSAATRQPAAPLPAPSPVMWRNWTVRSDIVQDPLEILAMTVNLSPSDPGWAYFTLEAIGEDIDGTISPEFSMLDVFLMKNLNDLLSSETAQNVSLADLNMSIGRAIAAITWYGRNSNSSSVQGGEDDDFAGDFGVAAVSISVVRSRLDLSLSPLIVGAVASVLLLILSLFLIRQPHRTFAPTNRSHPVAIDNAGVLQLTWLLGSEPHISHVEYPETDELRVAGLFEVNMAERVREKTQGVAYGEGASD